jgi:hypothetical protein
MQQRLVFLTLLFIVLLFNSCDYQPTKVEKMLKAKYNRDFTVVSDGYNFALGHYVFSAHPKEDTNMTFYGNYTKESLTVGDNFEQIYYNEIAKEKTASLISEMYKEQVFTKCNIMLGDVNKFGKGLIPLEEAIEVDSTAIFQLRILFLDTINNFNKTQILNSILQVCSFAKKFPGREYSMKIVFMNPSYKTSKDYNERCVKYLILNTETPDVREGIEKANRYGKYLMCFDDFNNPGHTLTMDSLYKTIKPFDENGVDYYQFGKDLRPQ